MLRGMVGTIEVEAGLGKSFPLELVTKGKLLFELDPAPAEPTSVVADDDLPLDSDCWILDEPAGSFNVSGVDGWRTL